MNPLQLLLPLLDLLVVTPRLPLLPLLGPARPLARLGPRLAVPGGQGRLGLLGVAALHHVDVGVDQVERGGGGGAGPLV